MQLGVALALFFGFWALLVAAYCLVLLLRHRLARSGSRFSELELGTGGEGQQLFGQDSVQLTMNPSTTTSGSRDRGSPLPLRHALLPDDISSEQVLPVEVIVYLAYRRKPGQLRILNSELLSFQKRVRIAEGNRASIHFRKKIEETELQEGEDAQWAAAAKSLGEALGRYRCVVYRVGESRFGEECGIDKLQLLQQKWAEVGSMDQALQLERTHF